MRSWDLRAHSEDTVVRSATIADNEWKINLGFTYVDATVSQLIALLTDDIKRSM